MFFEVIAVVSFLICFLKVLHDGTAIRFWLVIGILLLILGALGDRKINHEFSDDDDECVILETDADDEYSNDGKIDDECSDDDDDECVSFKTDDDKQE